jgi:prepilin-type N-terminal cleavage/methylation domain-containing protein
MIRCGGGRSAFSLVELLVVIAIVGVLLGLLLAAIAKGGGAGRRIACAANLADIGRQMQLYLGDSKGKLPAVDPIPSLTPTLPGVAVTTVFGPYTDPGRQVWKCPADRITQPMAGTPSGYETYFAREGMSYFYNPILAINYAGMKLADTPLYQGNRESELGIFWEFEPFHGRAGTSGAMNFLFADMHVGDME